MSKVNNEYELDSDVDEDNVGLEEPADARHEQWGDRLRPIQPNNHWQEIVIYIEEV